MQRWKLWSYENGLVLMMSLMNGIVALDRTAVSLLSPYIVPAFHLNNTELGLLASGLSVTIAGSGFLLASLADGTGRRKPIMIVMLVLFSLFSAMSGLATSFLMLLAARCVLGVAEGPLAPIGQSVVGLESAEHRRGLNMGIMLNVGAGLVGGGLTPILATHLADSFGWRSAFYLSAVPGLLLAVALVFWMRRPPEPPRSAPDARIPGGTGLMSLLGSRNILLCLLISGLYSAWLIVLGVFTPIYLTRTIGLKPIEMGNVLAMTSPFLALGGLVVPAISDRIGRRPALVGICFVGMLAPLALLFIHGPTWLLTLALAVGMFGGGAGPLYVAVVPTESAPARHAATAVAISLASGEIIGGVIAPTVAGRVADLTGPGAPFWICAAAAGVSGLLALLLKETGPAALRRQAASA
ncbi:MAG TPA: MFS transporter [Caulobacteraceae bacterium]|jgi:MFS family permease|nr:MFS transporter [Caulobacteraceae bacterium]